MINFAVVEVEDGYTVVEVTEGQTAEDAALHEGGVLIDPGPYTTYEQACDALDLLEGEEEEDDNF